MSLVRPSPAALRAAEFHEQRIRAITTHEEAVLIDARTGDLIWTRFGLSSSVIFDQAEIDQMQGNLLTHNHPRGWLYPADDPRSAGSSFSARDVAMMVDGRLVEIRAISPGYLHTLRPPSDDNQSLEANHYRTRIAHASYYEVLRRVKVYDGIVRQRNSLRMDNCNNLVTREQASAEHWHEVIELLVEAWGVEYQRKEWIP